MNRLDYLFKIGYINILFLFVYVFIIVCLNLDIGIEIVGWLIVLLVLYSICIFY